MKRVLWVFMFSCVGLNILFAFSMSKEFFFVHNLSEDDIVINMEIFGEIVVGESGQPIFDGRIFYHKINDIPISIDNELYNNRIIPNGTTRCISFYPDIWIQDVENNYYERLEAIPIIEKLKAVFKSFTITDTEGNILLTLANIRAEDIVKEDRSAGYYILKFSRKQ